MNKCDQIQDVGWGLNCWASSEQVMAGELNQKEPFMMIKTQIQQKQKLVNLWIHILKLEHPIYSL